MDIDLPRKNWLEATIFLLLSSLSFIAGVFLATAYPLAPLVAPFVFIAVVMLFVWQPGYGLLSLPVLLPLFNFSPWTGWLIVDEFDLLVLAVTAAGYFRMQQDGVRLEHKSIFLLLTIVILLILRGANDLVVQDLNLFSGYTTPLNSFRVGKSLLWVVLLCPLIAQAGKENSIHKAAQVFFVTCLLGSCGVVLAIFWERVFYPGLLDISTHYRTVGLFWEMHLGGAALDAYLVLLAPLLVWAWRTTFSLPLRLVVGAFVLAFVYACLTTFSRGVIGASAGSVILLGALLVWRRVKDGQSIRLISPAGLSLAILIMLEIVLVFVSDSFMNERLEDTERDFGGRLLHWEQGIGLLKTPGEWLLGVGLGKLPARLTQGETGLALPGAHYAHEFDGKRTMTIMGPYGFNSTNDLGGFYALTQRVNLIPEQHYHFAMNGYSEQDAEILVQVCAQHLLYPERCQSRLIRLGSDGWQYFEFVLAGPLFKASSWRSVTHGVVKISLLTPGSKIELAKLFLSAGGENLLRNSQFQEGSANWFPMASSYFLPWHIDNLYLEIMIETGLVGLLSFLGIVSLITRRLFLAYSQGDFVAPYFLASIAGLMALGLVVSVLDMPRIATLFGLFIVRAWQRPSAATK